MDFPADLRFWTANLDLYRAVLGKSQTIDALISAISFRISDELKLHSTLFAVNGQLEMILSGYD
jgi:hypothetical protein